MKSLSQNLSISKDSQHIPLEEYRKPKGELFMLVVLFITVTGMLMHFHFEQLTQQREVTRQMDPTGYADPKGITRNQTPALGL